MPDDTPIPALNVVKVDDATIDRVSAQLGIVVPKTLNSTAINTVLNDLIEAAANVPPKGSPWNVWVKFALTTILQLAMIAALFAK